MKVDSRVADAGASEASVSMRTGAGTPMRGPRLGLRVGVLTAALVAGVAASPASAAALTRAPAAAPALEHIPRFGHVITLVLENQNFATTWGPASPAVYLNSLRSQGTLATQYYATGHQSLDNYIALTSGQPDNGLTGSDCETVNLYTCAQAQQTMSSGANLADQLQSNHETWRGYMDATTVPCTHASYAQTAGLDPYQGDGKSPAPAGPDYADRHNPFIYYPDIVGDSSRCDHHVVPLTTLSSDLAAGRLPRYSFITPDTCHDGHDNPCSNGAPGGLVAADAWLQQELPPILAYVHSHDALLLITFDESATDDSGCCHGGPGGGPGVGGLVGLLAIGSHVAHGASNATPYDHASLLRTVEDALGISAYLNNAAASTPMTDLFVAT